MRISQYIAASLWQLSNESLNNSFLILFFSSLRETKNHGWGPAAYYLCSHTLWSESKQNLKNQPRCRYIFGVAHHVYHLPPICSKCIFYLSSIVVFLPCVWCIIFRGAGATAPSVAPPENHPSTCVYIWGHTSSKHRLVVPCRTHDVQRLKTIDYFLAFLGCVRGIQIEAH